MMNRCAILMLLTAACATAPVPRYPPSGESESPRARAAPTHNPSPQDQPGEASETALRDANNPLANMRSIGLHDYYMPELSGTDQTANQFWLRYAQPVSMLGGDWLVRASLPVSRLPTGPQSSESGLGDANLFATYLVDTGDPGVSFGAGPLLGLPTATDDALGTSQWSAGGAVVYFDASSPAFQFGGLVTYQHRFAGSERAADVNVLAVQPFGFLQLGGGAYVRSSGICAFDLERGNYVVPFGLGLGKVIKVDDKVFNFFIEPQFTMLEEGRGQPEFQVFVGFNTQLIGK